MWKTAERTLATTDPPGRNPFCKEPLQGHERNQRQGYADKRDRQRPDLLEREIAVGVVRGHDDGEDRGGPDRGERGGEIA